MWMTLVIVFDALQSFYGCQPEIACRTSQHSYKYCKKVVGLKSDQIQ